MIVLVTPSLAIANHRDRGDRHAITLGKWTVVQVGRSRPDIPNLLHRQLCALATLDVYGWRHRLHMAGVAAVSLPTKVVENRAIRNRAELLFVESLVERGGVTPNHSATIASSRFASIGNPARRSEATVLFGYDHGGRQSVPGAKPKVLPDADASLYVMACRNRGNATATTLAQAGGVWAFTRILNITHRIVSYIDGAVGHDRGRANVARSFCCPNYSGLKG